jgi:hypothetical protein
MTADGRTITGILFGIEKYPMIGDIVTTTVSGAAGLGILLISIITIFTITGAGVIGGPSMDWVVQDLPDLLADNRFIAAARPVEVPRGPRSAPVVPAAGLENGQCVPSVLARAGLAADQAAVPRSPRSAPWVPAAGLKNRQCVRSVRAAVRIPIRKRSGVMVTVPVAPSEGKG